MKVATIVQFAALIVPAVIAAPAAEPEPALMARDDHHDHHDHHDHCDGRYEHWNSHHKCITCHHDENNWWGDRCHRCKPWQHENSHHHCVTCPPWKNNWYNDDCHCKHGQFEWHGKCYNNCHHDERWDNKHGGCHKHHH